MRTLVFGDPHGNYPVLGKLLSDLEYVPSKDKIVFVGDYIDHYRWNTERNAKKTVEMILQLMAEAPDMVFSVRGNHDDWFDEWIRTGGVPPLIWYSQGGKETIKSYYPAFNSEDYANRDVLKEALGSIPDSHKEFFCNLPLYYHDENMLVVHAGLPVLWIGEKILAGIRDGADELTSIYRDDILWDREWQKGTKRHQEILAEVFGPDKLLIMGHTQGKHTNNEFVSGPFRYGNIINMDSFGLHCFVFDNETGKQYIVGVDDVLKW